MDRTDHKLTIRQTPINIPQKSLHKIDLQGHRGEHCIEDQRERISRLAEGQQG